MSWNPPPTQGFQAPPRSPQPHVITAPRPWYRRLRFMLPISVLGGMFMGVGLGSAGASPTPAVVTATTAAPASVTRTTHVTVTKTTAPKVSMPAAVQAVLKAWTNAGPEPDKQAAAMAQLKRQWPSLASALEDATGVKAPARTVATNATKAPVPTQQSSTTCGQDSYVNSDGDCVHDPVAAPSAPVGATAECNDGTYSFSAHRQGTCSHHGGVMTWL